MNCPRCGAEVDDWDDPRDHPDCPFVPCDDLNCHALKDPMNYALDLRDLVEHWRDHSYLGGCSHGA